MIIGEPLDIDTSNITTDLPEDDAPIWSATKTYNFGDEVIFGHGVFGSIIEGNLGKHPETNRISWARKDTTNAYRAFDGVLSNPTKGKTSIEYVIIGLNGISALALFDLRAQNVIVQFFNQVGEQVQVRNKALSGKDKSSFYRYLFSPPKESAGSAYFDKILSSVDKVKITFSGGNISIGEIKVIETTYKVGNSIMEGSTTTDILSRSVYQDNDFGVPTYIKRPSRTNSKFKVVASKEIVEKLYPTLKKLSGEQVIYRGSDERETTFGYGILRDINLPHDLPKHFVYHIDFEGIQ